MHKWCCSACYDRISYVVKVYDSCYDHHNFLVCWVTPGLFALCRMLRLGQQIWRFQFGWIVYSASALN